MATRRLGGTMMLVTTMLTGLVSAGVMVVHAAKPAPPPPPPLNVSFTNAVGDVIKSDGAAYDGYGFVGSQIDGAYINTNVAGGLAVNLVPGAVSGQPERAMVFSLDGATLVPTGGYVPPGCLVYGTVTAKDVFFHFNVYKDSNSSSTGIEAMDGVNVPLEVSSSGVLFGGHTYFVDGTVDFLPDAWSTLYPSVTNLRLRVTKGTTLVRSSDLSTWTLAPTEAQTPPTALLRCTVTNRGKVAIYDIGTYQVPFSLTASCNLVNGKCS